MAREVGMPLRDIATVLGNRICRGDTMIRFWGAGADRPMAGDVILEVVPAGEQDTDGRQRHRADQPDNPQMDKGATGRMARHRATPDSSYDWQRFGKHVRINRNREQTRSERRKA